MTEVDRNAAALTFEDDEDDGVACGVGPCIAVAIVNKSKRWAGSCHFGDVRYGRRSRGGSCRGPRRPATSTVSSG